MASATASGTGIRVGTVDELRREGMRVLAAEGRTILLVAQGDRIFAIDNRCPHMGFPLGRGTVRDGILTCHWHHARFDLAGGCTFDPFADDVDSFPVDVRNGEVWLDPHPVERDRTAHWLAKLDEALEQDLRLVMAKAVIGLDAAGRADEVLRRTALFGVRNRARGWADGLSILTSMANVRPQLRPEDRPRALFHGAIHVARNVAGQAPSFDLSPLATSERRPDVFQAWFRRFADNRSQEAAERCLRTAIEAGFPPERLAAMVYAAATDHLFMDTGHTLDFANKACELLDHIGWEHAGEVLPSLVPVVTGAQRMEETSAWRHPVDLPALVAGAAAELPGAFSQGRERRDGWDGHQALAAEILDGEPETILQSIIARVREGVPLRELSAAVAYAAARRPVHFSTSNEFADWNTVHHTFTYTNAVDQAVRRAPSLEVARGILDGAKSIYLERFLNVPKHPFPRPAANASRERLLEAFDRQGHVDETAALTAGLLATASAAEVVEALGEALLREDAGFHSFQIYEAAARQYGNFAGRPEGDHILLGAARFLAAHAPTVRAANQTFEIAARLNRGEALHDQ
jgi:nitrite reductase/ring-hydroxylating ferredoxin subunit